MSVRDRYDDAYRRQQAAHSALRGARTIRDQYDKGTDAWKKANEKVEDAQAQYDKWHSRATYYRSILNRRS